MKVSIDYNRHSPVVAKYSRLAETLKEEIEYEMVKATEHVVDTLSDNAPIDTGDLSKSFSAMYYWDANTFHSYVTSKSSYLQFLIMGTGKYNRTGNGRKTGWFWHCTDERSKYYGKSNNPNHDGNWYYTEGMEPNTFIEDSFKNEREAIRKGIKEALRRSLKDY